MAYDWPSSLLEAWDNTMDTVRESVPMTVTGATMTYEKATTVQTVSETVPVYPLKYIETENDVFEYTVSAGDCFYVDGIALEGYNNVGGVYYGFSERKGEWRLVNAAGEEYCGNIARLKTDDMTGKTQLIAGTEAGVVYLKYFINDNVYRSVESLSTYATNDSLTSTAVVKVIVAEDDFSGSIEVIGDISCISGESVDIDDHLTAIVMDEGGKQLEDRLIVWEKRYGTALDGAALEAGNMLCVNEGITPKAAIQLRARVGNTYSDWVTVTVLPARAFTSITPSSTTLYADGGDVTFTVRGLSLVEGDVQLRWVDTLNNEMSAPVTATGSDTEMTVTLTFPKNDLEIDRVYEIDVTLVKAAATESWGYNQAASVTVQSKGNDPDTYTLTFNANGGTKIAPLSRTAENTIDLTEYIPMRDGFEFTGWYTDAELSERITSLSLTGNTTVYAGWDWINHFTDVNANSWFYGAVRYICGEGLMNGTSANTFDPNGVTTRAMVVTTLWRLEEEPEPQDPSGFVDVAAEEWYTQAIAWAREEGIAKGYSDGTFGTNDPITREQLSAFFYRYAEYKDYDITIAGSLDPFADNGEVSGWARDAMEWTVGSGLMKGDEKSMLNPQANVKRSEFAAVLHRFSEAIR
ncbi:MAG: S-layer homology domain-containing protein [Bacillota bacterium]|nr:S-layer homology domain-containing protein [Bacillota bacterium]